jgi:hypothetical protein
VVLNLGSPVIGEPGRVRVAVEDLDIVQAFLLHIYARSLELLRVAIHSDHVAVRANAAAERSEDTHRAATQVDAPPSVQRVERRSRLSGVLGHIRRQVRLGALASSAAVPQTRPDLEMLWINRMGAPAPRSS